jgi:hypothetical protein
MGGSAFIGGQPPTEPAIYEQILALHGKPMTAFCSSHDRGRRMCDKTFLLLPLRWCVANYRQSDDRAVLGDDQEAGYPCSCVAKD